MYHWDLPQKLQDFGGWQNDTLAERFQEYANLCFDRFGSKVDTWITFNEPRETSLGGYEIVSRSYNPVRITLMLLPNRLNLK